MALYIINSTTINQSREEINKLIANSQPEIFDALEISINDLLNELSYNSLFSENRTIIVKNAHYFSTQNKELDLSGLENSILNPSNTVTIILLTDQKVDERKKIIKELKRQNALIICPQLTYKELMRKLGDKLKQDGYKIDQETLYYITTSCSNNYDLALNEIEKIKIYYNKPCQIKIEDIKNIISSQLENNNFRLIDAILTHRPKDAFKIYADLKLQKIEPIIILNLLAREYRFIYLIATMRKKNQSPFEIRTKLGLQEWQVDKYMQYTYNYNITSLKEILITIANFDYQIKTGKLNKHLAIEMLILKSA